MIQVNLLPDVKLEYIKSQQTKHMVLIGAVLVSIATVGLLALLFVYVQFIQPTHRSNLQTDIDDGISQLKNQPDGVKIVTVLGALEQIGDLQNNKVFSSNVFNYLVSFTPRDVAYNSVKLDFEASTLSLTGDTVNNEQANVLSNNLKSAKFTFTRSGSETPETITPFKNVVFANLDKSDVDAGNKISFELNFEFDPVMFSQGLKNPKLTVNSSSEDLLQPTAQPFNEVAPSPAPGS